MSKSRLKKVHKGLAIVFLLFFTTIVLDSFGFDTARKVTFYAIFPIFFWSYYHGAIFVTKSNIKAFNRLKNKQPIFTDSLTDDKDDLPYQKNKRHKDK